MTEAAVTTTTSVADLRDWRRLLDDPPDPETTERGRRLKEAAMLDFGVRESAIASWLYTKCHRQIPTLAVDTAAVVATGDGSCVLLYNPEFFAAIGADGVRFVLFHEARHLIHRHLYVDAELREDPVFALAAEVSINHVVMRRLRAKLPTRQTGGGTGSVREPVGIDPYAIHAQYETDLRAQGLEPLSYDHFTETDMTVYGELKRMSDPPVPAGAVCPHLLIGGLPLDDETVGEVVEGVLADVLRAALRGEGPAREEILHLADRSEAAASPAGRADFLADKGSGPENDDLTKALELLDEEVGPGPSPWAELAAAHGAKPLHDRLLVRLAPMDGCPASLAGDSAAARLRLSHPHYRPRRGAKPPTVPEMLKKLPLQLDNGGCRWLEKAYALGQVTLPEVVRTGFPAQAAIAFLSRAPAPGDSPGTEEVRATRRAVAALATEHLSDNPEGWALALRLAPDFEGTLPDLLLASGAVVG
ncbi:hypothetical protein ACFTTN_02045 [Streptomyces niveus]|uniref:DUF2201 family putative metallopeptidase n=1 Tax=Streptomyces niveus TaxID=193462 RepID=UPI00363C6005